MNDGRISQEVVMLFSGLRNGGGDVEMRQVFVATGVVITKLLDFRQW